MNRDMGQITTRQAVVGAVTIVLVIVVIVSGATALLPQPDDLPAVDDGAAMQPVPCPIPDESRPRRPPPPSQAIRPVAVTAAELIECPTTFDGRPVVYEGEVVRAILRRGDRAWVQLNDDRYAMEAGPLPLHHATLGINSGISVSVPIADADRITAVGSGHAYGDRLRVQGVFLRADPADAGAPAIQARAVEIIAVGGPIASRMSPARLVVALLLMAAAAAMIRAVWRSHRG